MNRPSNPSTLMDGGTMTVVSDWSVDSVAEAAPAGIVLAGATNGNSMEPF